jgi:tetratricopeptide (TPR) repeat protein
MGLKTRGGFTSPQPGANLSLRSLEQLLGPLEIEVLTFTVSEVSASPEEASVLYAMQLRLVDPRSGKTPINVSGARRVLEWTSIKCNCPQTGMHTWMLKRDSFDPEGLATSYLRARNDDERKFLLIGLDQTTLAETAGDLQRRGIEFIDSADYGSAFKILSHAQSIHREINSQARLSSQLDLEEYEQFIKQTNAAGNRPALALFLKRAAGIYAELKENVTAHRYLEISLPLFQEANDGLAVAEVYAELAELQLDEGDYQGAVAGLQKSMDQYLAVAAVSGSLNDSATSDFADVVGGLFLIYELQGREVEAERVVKDAQKALPDQYKALLIFARGLFQTLRGKVPLTFDDYEKAIELLRPLPRTDEGEVEAGLAGISLFLSIAHSMQGDYTKAAVNLQRTREVLLSLKLADPEVPELGQMPQLIVKLMEALFYETGSSESAVESRLQSLRKMIPPNIRGGRPISFAAPLGRNRRAPHAADGLNGVSRARKARTGAAMSPACPRPRRVI